MKFLGVKIDISKKVFRPRIETEYWLEKVLKDLKRGKRKFKVLDIFAGTGCIGISILKNLPWLCQKVDFVDISGKALDQIKINLKLNKILPDRYNVYQSNLFKAVKGKYDFIFANPPYVAQERLSEVSEKVLKTEPFMALLGGKGGIFWIKEFLYEVKNHLRPEGKVFMEFDPSQKQKIKEILLKKGFKFSFKKDQFKKYRLLKIYL